MTSALSPASAEPLLLGLAQQGIFLYTPAAGSQFPTSITPQMSFGAGDDLAATALDNGNLVIAHGA